jgi:hypothetical protein
MLFLLVATTLAMAYISFRLLCWITTTTTFYCRLYPIVDAAMRLIAIDWLTNFKFGIPL